MGWTKAKETVDYGEVELSMQRRGDFGGRMSVRVRGQSRSRTQTVQIPTSPHSTWKEDARQPLSLPLYSSLPSRPPSHLLHLSVLAMSPTVGPVSRDFNPYSDNGGTILAIAGEDFAVVAGDTRQSEGYNIQTRYAPKVFRLCVSQVLARVNRR